MKVWSSSQARRWQWAAALLLLVVLLPPLLALFADLLQGPGGLLQTTSLLSSPRLWLLFASTCGLSLLTTLVAVVLGVFLGVLFAKTDLRGRTFLLLCHSLPLCLPPFLSALGWFYLFGVQGYIGSETTSRWLFSPLGAVVVLGLCFSPVVTWGTILALQRIDPELEEAAQMHAAPPRIIIRLLLPMIRSSLLFSGMIVFVLCFSELGVMMFLRVKTYPALIFSRLGGAAFAPSEAFALCLPILLVAMLFLCGESRLHPTKHDNTKGSDRERRYPLGSWRWYALLLVVGAVVVALLPLLALGWRAGLQGFKALPQWLGWSLVNSLVVACAAATLIVSLGLVLGHARARQANSFRWLEQQALFSFMLPSVVFGVGLIAVWNRPSTGFLYRSVAIILLGLLARYAIFGIRAIGDMVRSSSIALEEAAAVFGAGYLRLMWRIIIPMHKRELVGIWLLSCLFCLRDLDAIITYYPPGWETLPIRIFTLEANGPEPVVAALACLHIAMTSVVIGIGLLWLRRRT